MRTNGIRRLSLALASLTLSSCLISLPQSVDLRGGSVSSNTSEKNRAPVILSFTSNPTNQVQPGGTITFTLDVVDRDGDSLKLTWSATGGTLSTTSGRVVSWTPPNKPGVYTVQVSANDGNGGTAEGAQNIIVSVDGASQIEGAPTTSSGTVPSDSQPNLPKQTPVQLTAEWSKVSIPFHPRRMFATSYDKVWVVGERGQTAYTTNGGGRWIQQKRGDVDLTAVFFLDDLRGWIGSADGTIFRTADGGQTWQLADFGAGSLDDIAFINESEGMAVGRNLVYRTADGGRTWTEFGTNGRGMIDRLTYLPDGSAWAFPSRDESAGATFRLSRGAWSPVTDRVMSIRMRNPMEGFSTGGGKFAKTTDGGKTWEQVPYLTTTERVWRDWSVGSVLMDQSGGLITVLTSGSSKASLYSSDGGSTWSALKNAPTTFGGWLYDGFLFDANHGWALGLDERGPVQAYRFGV